MMKLNLEFYYVNNRFVILFHLSYLFFCLFVSNITGDTFALEINGKLRQTHALLDLKHHVNYDVMDFSTKYFSLNYRHFFHPFWP